MIKFGLFCRRGLLSLGSFVAESFVVGVFCRAPIKTLKKPVKNGKPVKFRKYMYFIKCYTKNSKINYILTNNFIISFRKVIYQTSFDQLDQRPLQNHPRRPTRVNGPRFFDPTHVSCLTHGSTASSDQSQ